MPQTGSAILSIHLQQSAIDLCRSIIESQTEDI